ncbi:PorP/SprF family type IX secretion system membrane protein [Pedobacter montanisoli]|uniref:Type IX secretion system membrane protein PorP/SprF n=1 Tax=Pedobacter montanisoli TaxID=2923277 RepID=A0ABS9ZY29_9SPHI|nr:type IX secretion system membrane protein PorP/SprF [Pedobacter montanisoli]MCJ0743189.1 type IX secretion system membrane protein PorP/SprF [Pedobacter montanisoli]
MRLKIYILMIFCCLGLKVSGQQDAQYSQYVFNSIYINPAYAGYKERFNLNANYRAQWVGINGGPRTMAFAVDAVADDGKVGLALQITNDKLGAQSNLSVYANYAYRKLIGYDETTTLALGLGIGLQQSGLFGEMLEGTDPGDNYIPNGTIREIGPDVKTGVFLSAEKWYLGLSATNLVGKYFLDKKAPNFNYPVPKPHFYFTGGFVTPIVEDQIELKPLFLIKDDVGGPTVLDINAFILLNKKLWIGGGYRTGIKLYNKPNLNTEIKNSNGLIGMAEMFLGEKLRLGYSYDYSTSRLNGYSGSTHEISVSWYFSTLRERRINFCYF